MKLTQEELNNIVLVSAVSSYVCPICRKLIIPTLTINGDNVDVEVQRSYIKDGRSNIRMICCPDCERIIPKGSK